jgi:hypothetical protein
MQDHAQQANVPTGAQVVAKLAIDREAVCDARIEGRTLTDIAREHNCSRGFVSKICRRAGIVLNEEEEYDSLSPARTARMCANHLKDLQREHGKKER